MKSKKALNSKKPTTQKYLPIQEIKEDTVVLKDGTLRAVLMCSSINFSLKSEDEQNAIISSYVSFVNSLEHPIQIVAQSRKLQIKPYLEQLSKIENEQTNELLRMQIADYRAFVAELVEIGQIMTKKFYVVVPYDPLSNKRKSFMSRVKEVFKPAFSIRVKGEKFNKRKADLDLRLRQTISGLEGLGLQVARLDTQALVELYYSSYNPDISFSEELGKIEEMRVENI